MAQTKAQVSKLLTNVSNKYQIQNTIAELILPMIKVKQSTGILGGYGYGHLRQENDLTGGRGEARRVDQIEYDLDLVYKIQNHGLEDIVTEDDYDNVEEPFDAEVDKTEDVTSLILVNKEIIARNTVMDSAVVTQGVTLSGTDKFSDQVNSDPLGVAQDADNAILDGAGVRKNACIMSLKTFNYLKYHPQILGRLGFAMNRAGLLSVEDIKRAFDIEYLFIGDSAYNSAKQGQSDSLQQIWGDDMLFFHRPAQAAKKQVSFGYMLKKMGATERQVFKYPINNPVNATGIIVQDKYDFRIANAAAGYLVQSTY